MKSRSSGGHPAPISISATSSSNKIRLRAPCSYAQVRFRPYLSSPPTCYSVPVSGIRDSVREVTRMKKQGQPEPKLKWLDGTLRQFSFLTALRERSQVRRTCIDTLKLYREVAAELPQA